MEFGMDMTDQSINVSSVQLHDQPTAEMGESIWFIGNAASERLQTIF